MTKETLDARVKKEMSKAEKIGWYAGKVLGYGTIAGLCYAFDVPVAVPVVAAYCVYQFSNYIGCLGSATGRFLKGEDITRSIYSLDR